MTTTAVQIHLAQELSTSRPPVDEDGKTGAGHHSETSQQREGSHKIEGARSSQVSSQRPYLKWMCADSTIMPSQSSSGMYTPTYRTSR